MAGVGRGRAQSGAVYKIAAESKPYAQEESNDNEIRDRLTMAAAESCEVQIAITSRARTVFICVRQLA